MPCIYNPFIFSLFGFFIGGAFGSFASATAWAWINDKPIWIKRSICSVCGNRLKISQLIPIFSFLFLRGKCGFCKAPIPVFHFWIELFSGCLCGLIAALYGPQPLTLCYIPLAVALVTASAIDIKTYILPDAITIGCLPLCACIVCLQPDFPIYSAILGYLAAGAVPLAIYWIFRLWRQKETLGLGDVKLFALGGGLLGWEKLPFIFFFASFCGILAFICILPFKNEKDIRNIKLPFGPFICAAILAALFFPFLPLLFYNFVGYWQV